jgi:hypothetical protein
MPYKLADGGGLYLDVTPTGLLWRYDYRRTSDGKRKTRSHGEYGDKAEATEAKQGRRKTVEGKSVADAVAPITFAPGTFGFAANGWDALQKKQADIGKRSAKTRVRDERMIRYLNNSFGHTALGDVEVTHLSTSE